MNVFTWRYAAPLLSILLTFLALSACAAPAGPVMTPAANTPAPGTDGTLRDVVAAEAALETFLLALHEGRYADAAPLYAGDHTNLRYWNPVIAPDDTTALLQAGCEVNGMMCLKPAGIAPGSSEGDTQVFFVRLLNTDGAPFVLKPPPGAPGTPQDTFELRVRWTEEGPRVVSLPPTVP